MNIMHKAPPPINKCYAQSWHERSNVHSSLSVLYELFISKCMQNVDVVHYCIRLSITLSMFVHIEANGGRLTCFAVNFGAIRMGKLESIP